MSFQIGYKIFAWFTYILNVLYIHVNANVPLTNLKHKITFENASRKQVHVIKTLFHPNFI